MNTPAQDDIRARIVNILVRDFDVDPAKVSDDASFRGTFAMDSTDVVDFIAYVENEFGLTDELEGYHTLHEFGELVTYVTDRLKEVSEQP